MRLLFVADARSPTTLSWLRYWISRGDEVHLISTYPSNTHPQVTSYYILPVAFSGFSNKGKPVHTREVVTRLRDPLRALRYILGPVSLLGFWGKFQRIVKFVRPDIIHALRIPFEGMLSYHSPVEIPFLVSTWGNDITLHARGSLLMAILTHRVLCRVDGLLADSQRDIRLGHAWGLRPNIPTLVVPGSGGIQLEKMKKMVGSVALPEELPNTPLVVNPRGQRPGSLRQDKFIRAIPRILEKIPDVNFICPSLCGDTQVENLIASLGISDRVHLWPQLSQPQLWTLFSRAQVFVSPSLHDGTPNSLLEAMALGCFPVTGNIESMREWITDHVNGILVDATDSVSIADAIIRPLSEPALQRQAANVNAELVAERADYSRNMLRVLELYESELRSG
jgi:glycosyltransferase involved in cell wall biosynthesis